MVTKQTKATSKKQKAPRKQTSTTKSSASEELPPAVRFSATIHPREKMDPKALEKLDIDRIPDPTGVIRALVTPADCVRLVNQGFEVRLHRAYPVQPLNPKLIEPDDSFKRWLDNRIQNIKGAKKKG